MNFPSSSKFLLAAFDLDQIWWIAGILILMGILMVGTWILISLIFAWNVRRYRNKLACYLSSLDQWRIEPEGKSLKDYPFFSAILSEAIPDYKPSPMGSGRGESLRWMFYYPHLGLDSSPSFSNCLIIVSYNEHFAGSLRLRNQGNLLNRMDPRHLYNYLRVDFILNDNNLQGWHVLNQGELDKELLADAMQLLQKIQCVREVNLSGPYICCITNPGEFRHDDLEKFRCTSLQIEEIVANHRMKQQT
jgi:hypothetical protein